MKGNNKKRTRKRILALALCALMLTTLLENVAYNPYAGTEENADTTATVEELVSTETAEDVQEDIVPDDLAIQSDEVTTEASVLPSDDAAVDEEVAETDDTEAEEAATEQPNATSSETTAAPGVDTSSAMKLLNGSLSAETKKVSADANDIQDFLSKVDLYESGSSTPMNVTWEVDADKTYRMNVFFEEDSSDENMQFHMDPDNHTFTYALPAGINVEYLHELNIKIEDDNGLHVFNVSDFTAVPSGDRTVISGTFPTDDIIKGSNNVRFYFDFDASFSAGVTSLPFSSKVTYPIIVDDDSSVKVSKTSSLDLANGKINYTVKIDATRLNENVVLNDVVSGTALTLNNDITLTPNPAGASVTKNGNAFTVNIPEMNNESVTVTYSADLDMTKIAGSGSVSETKNTATVKSDDDPTEDTATTSEEGRITYGDISKNASAGDLVEVGDTTYRKIDYTVTYNSAAQIPIKNTTLTDTMGEYSADLIYGIGGDNKCTIKKYAAGSDTPASTVEETISASNGSWSVNLNDDTAYKYVITYSAYVDVTDGSPKNTNNIIADNKGHNPANVWHTAQPGVTTDDLNITKTHTNVDLLSDPKTITWEVVLTVPENGLPAGTTIVDEVPKQWINNASQIDALYGNVTCSDDSVHISKSEAADHSNFTLTFDNGIANNTGAARDITFTYKTLINETTLASTDLADYYKDHTNRVTVTAGTKTKSDSDSAIAILPYIKKEAVAEESWQGDLNDKRGQGWPVYKFRVIISNPETKPFTLTDTFPGVLKIASGAEYKAPSIYPSDKAGNQLNNPTDITGSVSGGSISIPAGDFAKNGTNDYDFYTVVYYLVVKDAAAFASMESAAYTAKDNTVTYKNSVTGPDFGTSSADFTYTSKPITKELINNSASLYTEGGAASVDRNDPSTYPEYKVTINPAGLTINGGAPFSATDQFTNLSLIYTTISVTPSNAGITWDMSGNKITFSDIPDATPVTITYKARIIGTPGADKKIVFSNSFSSAGATDAVVRTADVSAEAGGSGDVKSITIMKYPDGAMNRGLNGAQFALYEGNTPVLWRDTAGAGLAGTPVVVTTGEDNDLDGHSDGDGLARISQQYIPIYESKEGNIHTYRLREIKAPAGYMLDDTDYFFELVTSHNPVYGNDSWQFLNNDILKVRNYKPSIYFTKVGSDNLTKGLPGAEFTLYGAKSDGTVDTANVVATATSDANGKVNFKDLNVAASGETIFFVKETGAPSDDYNIDANYYKVTYSYDAEGNIVMNAEDPKVGDRGLFVDTVKTGERTGSVNVSVTKYFNGHPDNVPVSLEDKFRFSIGEISVVDGEAALAGAAIPAVSATDAFTFDDTTKTYKTSITYRYIEGGALTLGDHYYVIKEEPSGFANIIDSEDVYLMKVTLAEDGADPEKLTVSKTIYFYRSGAAAFEQSEVVFDNHSKPVTWAPEVTKTLYNATTGAYVNFPAGKYSFSLQETTAGTKHGTAEDTQASVYADASTVPEDGGKAHFAPITYTCDDVGKTFTYTVTENRPSDPEVKIDDSYANSYNVSVSIDVDQNGNIVVTPAYERESTGGTSPADAITFKNTRTEKEGSFIPEVSKLLDGKSDMNGLSFDFSIYSVDDPAVTTENAAKASTNLTWIETKSTGSTNTVTFDSIDYSTATGPVPATYFYKIVEDPKADYAGNIAFDEGCVIVKVTVDRPATGDALDVNATYTYFPVSGLALANHKIFNNETVSEKKLSFAAKKTLSNAALEANQFTFILENRDTTNELTAGGIKVKNDASGNVFFQNALTFDENDIGNTYKFTLREDQSEEGYKYDESYYEIDVTVERNETDGSIVCHTVYYKVKGTDRTKIYDSANPSYSTSVMSFVNERDFKDAQVEIKVKKILKDTHNTGVSLDNNHFTFRIVEVDSDSASASEIAGTEKTVTTTNGTGIATVFEKTFKEADLGGASSLLKYYRITEVDNSLLEPGFSYSDAAYTVKMNLVKNASTGEILVTQLNCIKGENKDSYTGVMDQNTRVYSFNKPFEFTNEVKVGTLTLSAEKSMKASDVPLNGGEFTFTARRVTSKDATGRATAYGESVTAENAATGAGGSAPVAFAFDKYYTKDDVTASTSAPYTYEITEAVGDTTKYIFDNTVYYADVVFEYNASGEIVPISISYYTIDQPDQRVDKTSASFANEIIKNTSFAPSVTKELTDYVSGNPIAMGDGMFSFRIGTAYDGTSVSGVIETVPNLSNGSVVFSANYYSTTDLGDATYRDYVYYVQEDVKTGAMYNGYHFDPAVYKITVRVEKDATNGDLTATPTYEKTTDGSTYTNASEIVFRNTIETSNLTAWPIYISKTIPGNDAPGVTYSFDVQQVNGAAGTGTIGDIVTVNSVPATGMAEFNATLVDNTDYFFRIYEKNTGIDGVTYDGNTYIIKVRSDGNTPQTWIVNRNGVETTAPELYTGGLVFTNHISIGLNKTDAYGNGIDGATMRVLDADGNVVRVSGAASDGSFPSSASADTELTDLAVGEIYTFEEVKAPYGFEKAAPLYFKIEGANGAYKLFAGADAASMTERSGLTLSMIDRSKSIAIKKTDTAGSLLSGAKFDITTVAGASVLSDITVPVTGVIAVPVMKDDGTARLEQDTVYKLVETAAPTGYDLAAPVFFKLDSDNFLYTGSSAANLARVTGTTPDTIAVTDASKKVAVIKSDEDGNRVAGARLSIEGINNTSLIGNETYVRFNTAGATDKTFDLVDFTDGGQYMLSEVSAPGGYDKAESIRFKRNGDTILIDADKNGSFETDATDATGAIAITMTDYKTSKIYVRKVGLDDRNTLLAGATLSIKSADGTKVVDEAFVTNGTAPKEFLSSQFDKNRDYVLREIGAPNGYSVSDISVTFRVTETGKVEVKNAAGQYVTNNMGTDELAGLTAVNTLTLVDMKQFQISKVAVTGGPELPGAKIEIRVGDTATVHKSANGRDLKWTSGSAPKNMDLADFVMGQVYTLHETTAPNGYDVAEDIRFMIDNNGRVLVEDASGNFVARDRVVMVDAPAIVKFSKKDMTNGDELPGARITITDTAGRTASDRNGRAMSWISSDTPHEISADNFTPGKVYKMTEITAPTGFEVAESIFFTVERDAQGKYIVLAGATEAALSDTGNRTVEMQDRHKSIKVKISKTDITGETEVSGARLELYDETGTLVHGWTSKSGGSAGTHAEEFDIDLANTAAGMLVPGKTYTLKETVAPNGYQLTTDTTFTLKADGSIDAPLTTADYSVAPDGTVLILVRDSITSLNFTKYGYPYESCAEGGDQPVALRGVEFSIYETTAVGDAPGQLVSTMVSNRFGVVSLDMIPKGTYAIKETGALSGFIADEHIYYAVVDDDPFEGLLNADGSKVSGNRLVNDRPRTDFTFTKVSERDEAKKLSGSTYGLYKTDDTGTETLIATEVTDDKGVITFKGLLPERKYLVRELVSPDGYYISKHPIEFTYEYKNGKVQFKDGSPTDGAGTVKIVNGQLVWLEPSVVVSFLKTDMSDHALPGAKLCVYDSTNQIVKDQNGDDLIWTSTDKPIEVADCFNDGETYRLVEMSAPDGYEIAEAVSFTIPSEGVGPDEGKVISVSMKDEKTKPASPTDTTEVKTGDMAPVKIIFGLMIVTAMGIVLLFLHGRKKKGIPLIILPKR